MERIFSKFKESEKFSKMVKELVIFECTIMFKINIFRLVTKCPKLNNSSFSTNSFKRHFKQIAFTCKTSAHSENLRPEDISKKCPDVLKTYPYCPICNAKGRILSGKSLGRTQDVNLTIFH